MRIVKFFVVAIATLVFSSALYAQTAEQINRAADLALKQFNQEVKGSIGFVNKNVKGLLIFPSIVKAGIGIGGEYGEGVLRINGKSVMYYSTASASVGLQFGVQQKSLIIAFMTEKALNDFRNKSGWEVGVDGSVALATLGAGGELTSETINQPVIGFMFGNKGLMYNLTLEGSKFTKIVR